MTGRLLLGSVATTLGAMAGGALWGLRAGIAIYLAGAGLLLAFIEWKAAHE